MINKKARTQIATILLKRRKELGKKQISAMNLYADFYWLMNHSGLIIEDLEKSGIVK